MSIGRNTKKKRVQFGHLYGPNGTNLGRPSAGNATLLRTAHKYTLKALKAGVNCIGEACFSKRAVNRAKNAIGYAFGEKRGQFGSTRRLVREVIPRQRLTVEEERQKMMRRIWADERRRRARNNSRALRLLGPYRPRYRGIMAQEASQSGPKEQFPSKSAPTPPAIMDAIVERPPSPSHNKENGNEENGNENNNNANEYHATGGRTRRRHRAK